MADAWDDDDGDDDDWDVDEAELDAKFSNFDDEKDLTIEEEKKQKVTQQVTLKKKGQALAAKKRAEQERKDEMEIARRTAELEAEMEAKMSMEERRELERRRVEEADNALTEDLFGAVDDAQSKAKASAQAEDKVVMKTLADHMKYARKVSYGLKDNGQVHMALAFFVEALQQSKDVLDDAAITEIIKTCNVIKNEKVQAAKRKVKGQAQKSKKSDKVAAVRAKKIQDEVFGDSNKYDKIDEMGAAYEDDYDFF